jgi:hypothetical protein
MKYHEAINGPDNELWKAEVAKEHQRMIDRGVFEPVKLGKVPKGVKLIDTTWAMKNKSSGTLRGRVNLEKPGGLPSPTRINSFLRQSFRPWVSKG